MAPRPFDPPLPEGSVASTASGRPRLASCSPPSAGRSRGGLVPWGPSCPSPRSLESVRRSAGRSDGPSLRPASGRAGLARRRDPPGPPFVGGHALGAPLPSARPLPARRSPRARLAPAPRPPGPPFVGGHALGCVLLRPGAGRGARRAVRVSVGGALRSRAALSGLVVLGGSRSAGSRGTGSRSDARRERAVCPTASSGGRFQGGRPRLGPLLPRGALEAVPELHFLGRRPGLSENAQQ